MRVDPAAREEGPDTELCCLSPSRGKGAAPEGWGRGAHLALGSGGCLLQPPVQPWAPHGRGTPMPHKTPAYVSNCRFHFVALSRAASLLGSTHWWVSLERARQVTF